MLLDLDFFVRDAARCDNWFPHYIVTYSIAQIFGYRKRLKINQAARLEAALTLHCMKTIVIIHSLVLPSSVSVERQRKRTSVFPSNTPTKYSYMYIQWLGVDLAVKSYV
jgi:hypothetical protein